MANVSLPVTLTNGNVASATEVMSDLNAITAQVNGNLDATNLAAAAVTADKVADADKLGLSGASTVRRGKSIIATTESRTNSAFGLMPTPDRVQNVVLPQDGLICVLFDATWQQSVANAAFAAIFVGANQLLAPSGNGPATAFTGQPGSQVAADQALASHALGLAASATISGSPITPVTTGQAIGVEQTAQVPNNSGGPCYIWAAAGTYDVSVQFRASSGSVTAKNRKLWVWTMGF